MTDAIVLDQNDIKKLIAKEYGIDEKEIIKAQYSYVVPKKGDTNGENSGQNL